MTLAEGFAKNEVFIDFGSEVHYGRDQCFISYPCVFPTVDFQLIATYGLMQIADRIRIEAGFKPMHPLDEYFEENCDNEGWYDFYVGINGYDENHMDACITFIVENSESEDNEQMYSIDLTAGEQKAIYNRLDEQCRRYLEKSCEDLLREADIIMRKDLEYERTHPEEF